MNMKRVVQGITVFLMTMSSLICGAGMFDDGDDVLQVIGKGEINWTRGLVRASGSGSMSTDISNIAVAKLGAERAAKLDAIRNILETVKGIRVDSETRIEDYLAVSEYIQSRLQGVVNRAEIVEKRHLPDGVIEVVVEAPLTGGLTEIMIAHTGDLTLPSSGDQVYSGLIIDATGLVGVKPAMAPKIIDGGGRELYGYSYVSKESAIKYGIAGYVGDIESALESERVLDNPLIIKGIRASGAGGSDIVVGRSDAMELRDKSKNMTFLEHCNVIIVID